MHPQLEPYVKKIDEFMSEYPILCQYDRFLEVEKMTGYSKVYFFSAVVAMFGGLIYFLGGVKLVSDLFGFLYPAYMSFKAIESSDPVDDTEWLTYWIVFGTFSIFESVAMFLVEYIPFYYVIKAVFFTWLFHPKFLGAALLYNHVKPYLTQGLQPGEDKPQKKED